MADFSDISSHSFPRYSRLHWYITSGDGCIIQPFPLRSVSASKARIDSISSCLQNDRRAQQEESICRRRAYSESEMDTGAICGILSGITDLCRNQTYGARSPLVIPEPAPIF